MSRVILLSAAIFETEQHYHSFVEEALRKQFTARHNTSKLNLNPNLGRSKQAVVCRPWLSRMLLYTCCAFIPEYGPHLYAISRQMFCLSSTNFNSLLVRLVTLSGFCSGIENGWLKVSSILCLAYLRSRRKQKLCLSKPIWKNFSNHWWTILVFPIKSSFRLQIAFTDEPPQLEP